MSLLRCNRLTVVAVLMGIASPSFAQNPPRGRTLEDLVNSPEAEPAPTKPAALPAESGPKRPAGTLVRPKDSVKHPDLDKAWADYDVAVAKTTETLRAAITKQFDAAAAKGDLDAAEKWQAALERFEKAGEVPTDAAAKTAVSSAVAEYTKAKDKLTEAYESVVKVLTMEKKISEAKAAREEAGSLDAQPSARITKRPDVQAGLLGEYYSNNLKVGETIDDFLSFGWGGGSPEGLPSDWFQIRWSGSLVPPQSGDYVITGESDDGVRIIVDEHVLVATAGTGSFRSERVQLTRGKSHKVQIEYYEQTGDAYFSLGWIKPDGTRQLVPKDSLVPSRAPRRK
jgi:hypothetical protein